MLVLWWLLLELLVLLWGHGPCPRLAGLLRRRVEDVGTLSLTLRTLVHRRLIGQHLRVLDVHVYQPFLAYLSQQRARQVSAPQQDHMTSQASYAAFVAP